MNKFVRRAAVAFAALIATAGVVAMPTAAEADSGWGWRVAPTSQGPNDITGR